MDPDVQDVVAWGSDEPPRSRFAALLDRPLVSHPLTPLWTAGTGGALIVASLLTDWLSTESLPGGSRTSATDPFVAGAGGLGAWSAGYLIGLLVLGTLTALILFGDGRVPPRARQRLDRPRRYARVAALGWAAGLFVMLFALSAAIGSASVLGPVSSINKPAVHYGPGVFLAMLGVAAAAAGIYLMDRPPPGGFDSAAGTEANEETEDTEADEPEKPAPAAQPPARRPMAPRPARAPSDLTVTPVAPFAYLPEHTRHR